METQRDPELVNYLNAADLIVGYAIKHYDLKVLEELTGKKITAPVYDLCDFAAEALGGASRSSTKR